MADWLDALGSLFGKPAPKGPPIKDLIEDWSPYEYQTPNYKDTATKPAFPREDFPGMRPIITPELLMQGLAPGEFFNFPTPSYHPREIEVKQMLKDEEEAPENKIKKFR